VWVHLGYSDAELARWVSEESGVAAVVAEALLSAETRPRSLDPGEVC
jgi:zinc transporter